MEMAAERCDADRFRLARIVLQELRETPLSWSELEKRVVGQCGTHSKFKRLIGWMVKQGYILKTGPSGSRTPYRINFDKVKFLPNGEVSIKL